MKKVVFSFILLSRIHALYAMDEQKEIQSQFAALLSLIVTQAHNSTHLWDKAIDYYSVALQKSLEKNKDIGDLLDKKALDEEETLSFSFGAATAFKRQAEQECKLSNKTAAIQTYKNFIEQLKRYDEQNEQAISMQLATYLQKKVAVKNEMNATQSLIEKLSNESK